MAEAGCTCSVAAVVTNGGFNNGKLFSNCAFHFEAPPSPPVYCVYQYNCTGVLGLLIGAYLFSTTAQLRRFISLSNTYNYMYHVTD